MEDIVIKAEEPSFAANRKAGYKSWKKKYRKMRVHFEHKMHEGEELHKQEERTQKLIKRLALENDQLLDLLFEINNSPQIPPEKKIDLALPSSKPSLHANNDGDTTSSRKSAAAKRLEDLLSEVPHTTYAATNESKPPPEAFNDLQAPEGETYPGSFFSPDDVDNAMYRYDHEMSIIEPNNFPLLPTLAPIAHPEQNPQLSHLLRNPVSVTNWLRKNAPKIFLQDGDKAADAPNAHADEDVENQGHVPAAGGKSSKSRLSKAAGAGTTSSAPERQHARDKDKDKDSASTPSAAKPSSARSRKRSASKPRPSAASASTTPAAAPASKEGGERVATSDVEEDGDYANTPIVAKGKRKRDEDPGYRPKGGSSSRPSKKKRKSAGGEPSSGGKKKEKEAVQKTD